MRLHKTRFLCATQASIFSSSPSFVALGDRRCWPRRRPLVAELCSPGLGSEPAGLRRKFNGGLVRSDSRSPQSRGAFRPAQAESRRSKLILNDWLGLAWPDSIYLDSA